MHLTVEKKGRKAMLKLQTVHSMGHVNIHDK